MKVVTYYRVSTAAQGRSGLGLEAQRDAVEAFCRARGCEVLAEFTEVESGNRNDRPQLTAALHRAKVTGATLVIAKLDRLSRNAAFLLTLRDSGVEFIAADMPDACRLTVGILAMVAEQEREAISARTKAALASVKARGMRLGNPHGATALRRAGKGNAGSISVQKADAEQRASDLASTIAEMRAEGHLSLSALAHCLNERHIKTARGGRWHPSSVRNLLARIPAH